jgi:hypothetical protein
MAVADSRPSPYGPKDRKGQRDDNNEDTTMTTLIPSLRTFAAGLVALSLAVAMPGAASAALDGSVPLLCAITTIMECDDTGHCQRHTTQQHPDFPPFLRINVREGMITGGDNSGRKTEIKSSTRLDGRLMLYGGENGRGWAATIAEDTGRMTAGVVASDFTFNLFGACTTP